MNDIERIMLECRYILSIRKNYEELACAIGVNREVVVDDLNVKLKNIDQKLYERVQKELKCV